MTGHRSRAVEDFLAILGGLIVAGYVVTVEMLPQICYTMGKCLVEHRSSGVPWGVLVLVAACVLPKTLGRVSAGKVWEILGSRLPGVKPPDGDGTAG